MNKKQEIPIVLVSSNEFIQYCATTLASILVNINASVHVKFYIFSYNLTDKNKNELNKLKHIGSCDINYPILDDQLLKPFQKVKIPNHVSKLTYLRLLVPDLLPQYSKAIFIDSDTIVRSDISELFNIDLGDKYYGMVEDVANLINSKYLWGEATKDYYNGGVLLINLEKLRQDHYVKQMEEHLDKNIDKYLICDQDVLNDSFRGKILRISNKWNFFHEYHFLKSKYTPTDNIDYENSVKNPAVVHFVGKIKPWHNECKHKYKKEWLAYFKKTPFFKTYMLQNLKKNTSHFLQQIFSVKNENKHKVCTICGIKIKTIKPEKEETQQQLAQQQLAQQQLAFEDVVNIHLALENVKQLHLKTLPPFKDIYKGQDVVIVGSGPSLNKYTQMPNAIHMGLNRTFRNPKLKLDYLFAWDYNNLKKADPQFFEDLKQYDCKKFFGCFLHDSIGQVPKCIVEDLNAYQLYSSARFGFNTKIIDPTIHYNIEISPLMDFMSVAFFAFHFALYTNPKRIFLVGLDNSLNGYFDNKTQQKFLMTNEILADWKKVKVFMDLYYPEIEVISINPIGLKGLFKDEYTNIDEENYANARN